MKDIPVDMTSGAWAEWLTSRVDPPDLEPPEATLPPLQSHTYIRRTTYTLGSHTRTKTTRVISTFNPNAEEAPK